LIKKVSANTTLGRLAVKKNPDLSSDSASSSPPTATDRFRDQLGSRQSSGSDGDSEKLLWQGNYCPQALAGPASLATLISVGMIVATLIYEIPGWPISAGVIVLLWVGVVGTYLVRRASIQYELTCQRFIHQSGLIRRRTDRIEVIDIEDVSFVQGPVERIMGIGTIEITSTDRSHPHLTMPGIANVRVVAGQIDDVRRRERKRRSVHIQTM